MTGLIERYIYDVTRRLPEKERADVKRELETSISDMLPDNPSEQDVIDTLNRLGAPEKLAGQYRQKPQYLISPAMYDTYITAIKNVVVIVACACACVGAFVGIGALGEDASAADVFAVIIEDALGHAIQGVMMALFWTTLGFVIADRSGYRLNENKEWTVAKLPALPDQNGVNISRVSTVVSAVMVVFFTVLYVVFINKGWFSDGAVSINGAEIIAPFSQAALARSISLVIGTSCVSLVMHAVKFFYARWNVKVLLATIAYDACWLAAALYIVHWPDLISEALLARISAFLEANNIIVENFYFYRVMFIILLVGVVIDIGSAAWNTLKSRRA